MKLLAHIEADSSWLLKVEDCLFEGMSLEKSKTFPLVFLEAIQPGMVLESIKKSFLIYILEQALTTFDNEKFTDVRDSILRVITLHKTTFDAESGAEVAAREAETVAGAAVRAAEGAEAAAKAVRAAATAAAAAARAAVAWAMGREAAKAVAEAAEAAGWAAWAQEATGAWARGREVAKAARAAAYDKYADKLIELIKQCTIER